jgi:protein TonB
MFGKLDILKRGWTDVIFKGRNKEYGAYELRTTNARTTNLALIIGGLVFVFIISLNTIINAIEGFIPKAPEKVKLTDVKLLKPPPVDPAKKPPPPPPEPPKPKTAQVKFPPPVVKPDNEVKEPPPTVTELKNADPGPKTQAADPNGEDPIDQKAGDADTKQAEADPNQIFVAVEQQATFAGPGTYTDFLTKNLKVPAVDKENGTGGKVILNFVVEVDGSVSNIKVLRSPDESLQDEAIRVVKMMHWHPGIQNARKVRSYFTLPINFSITTDE